MNEKYLAHHGVIGMKWGVRRYQKADGTYTSEGKKRYVDSYRTNRLKSKKADRKTIENSEAVDKKVAKYIKNTSRGKALAGTLLVGGSSYRTYATARALGEGRVKSMLRSVFDINLANIVSGAIASPLKNVNPGLALGAGMGLTETIKNVSLQEHALYEKYNKKHR